MKFSKSIASMLLACTIGTTIALVPQNAFAAEFNDTIANKSVESDIYGLSQEDWESIMPFLEIIDEMPMELLEEGNSTKINNYFSERGLNTHVYNPDKGETFRVKRKNALRCGLALGQLAVTVGIPATQIMKVKRYINSLGGAIKAAKLIVGAATAAERAAAPKYALIALGEILLTITGIADIRDYCFD